MSDLERIENSKRLAFDVVKQLPFMVGEDDLAEAKRHLWLAFGRASKDLFKCSDESIGYAIALSAMTGLYPGGPRPDVWLIPRRNKKKDNVLEVNWQMASRGYQRLASRAGFDARAFVVHAHDDFDYEAAEPRLVHRPDVDKEGNWGTIRCAYVKITDPKGAVSYCLLRKDQINKRRRTAQDDSIWAAWPEEQTLKTMYSYAGAREEWPTTPAVRFAMEASTDRGDPAAIAVASSPSAPPASPSPPPGAQATIEDELSAPDDPESDNGGNGGVPSIDDLITEFGISKVDASEVAEKMGIKVADGVVVAAKHFPLDRRVEAIKVANEIHEKRKP